MRVKLNFFYNIHYEIIFNLTFLTHSQRNFRGMSFQKQTVNVFNTLSNRSNTIFLYLMRVTNLLLINYFF